MDEFTDKVVLITGAGHGLGRELALAFASMGLSVAANDINPLNLDETVSQVIHMGGKARSYVFDIAKRMPIEGMLAQVLEHFGRLDVLINHAAVRPDASLLEMDEWDFHRTLDVNLGGPFFTMQLAGRIMQQAGAGSIVNLVSTPNPGQFKHGFSAFSASAAGLLGLTQSAAKELAAHHVRLNAACCGPNCLGKFTSANLDIEGLHEWSSSHPQLRVGEHAELDRLVLFLCSPEASSVTGQIFTYSFSQ
ncbi:MAG TPA: SDR family NAD(P)-dependent oxidoreductase [Anaerolineales bacterium]